MSSLFIHIMVLSLYMVALILVGIWTSKRAKSTEDYHIGGRSIGPWVSAISFLAAYFSSVVIIGGGGFGYKYGFSTIWIGVGNLLIGCMLAWLVLGKRVWLFTTRLNTMTVPSFLSERYKSNFSRFYAAIIIMLLLIIYNVSVLKGMAQILKTSLDLNYDWAVIICGLIVVFYVFIGGYVAVVWTGLIQGWLMIFGLLLVTYFTLDATGNIGNLSITLDKIASIPIADNPTEGMVNWGWLGLTSFTLIVSFGVWGMPQLLARFYSIKDAKTLKIGTLVVSIGGLFAILPFIVGVLGRYFFPVMPKSWSDVDEALPNLVKYLMGTGAMPEWVSAVFLAGVIAAGMSTIAAILIIMSSALMKDIIEDGFKMNFAPKKSLLLSKVASVLLGVIAIIIALNPPDLILNMTAFAWSAIASVCLWPILLGIYWKGVTKTGVEVSMLGGSLVTLFWYLIPIFCGIKGKLAGIDSFIAAIIASLVLIVVVSMLTKKLPEAHIKHIWGER